MEGFFVYADHKLFRAEWINVLSWSQTVEDKVAYSSDRLTRVFLNQDKLRNILLQYYQVSHKQTAESTQELDQKRFLLVDLVGY